MIKTIKHILNEIKENGTSWEWWKHRYSARILHYIIRNKGQYIVDEKWDNLIILDACRYDTFKEINTIEGELESRISRGSNTREFLLENFGNHPKHSCFGDIVYIAGNPFVSLLLPDKFYKIYQVWDYGWDDDLNTVPPENVFKETLKAHQQHPDKRLIIHFVQPHEPFLGTKFSITGLKHLRNAVLQNRDKYLDINWGDLVETGKIGVKEVWLAYKENLKIVLPYVKDLTDMLPGRTIVTSDHCELFGERPHPLYPFREYGHHCEIYVKQLVVVPWLTVNQKEKREILKSRARSKSARAKKDEERIKARLRALGYTD